ncbi:ribosome maturation factor RimM [Lactobacillus psittaci]|uniref:Ribosome maturation factor RimM n=1 Tax=Lactobacillus psittaci DSM 15354 TaxID=1122152 RepID=A0A0R1SBS0_9LACO|nr:ribosome maturation factor RimM [Lactobacillus psittaci]KRL64002.1 16S rRNA processing protein RimM [Lactobacillus psittaci DSM 15354]
MQYYDVAQILTSHGLKGEVKVKVITDFPEERFSAGTKLEIKETKQQLTVKSGRPFKQFWLVTFAEIADINEAEKLFGKTLVISEENQPELPEGQYYYHQILGLTVLDNLTGEKIGQITDVESPGANDIWQVTPQKGKPFWLPYVPAFVKDVNLDKGEVRVELMEGLRDED